MVLSILGMPVISYAFPSASRVMLSTISYKEVIRVFLPLISQAVNHPDHLPPFLTGAVILFRPRKGED